MPGRLVRRSDARMEGGHVVDDVVGRERAQDGVRVLPLEHGGGEPDRGHGVAGGRLDHERTPVRVLDLARDEVGMPATGDHQDVRARQRPDPIHGVAEHRLAGSGQVEQVFRPVRP